MTKISVYIKLLFCVKIAFLSDQVLDLIFFCPSCFCLIFGRLVFKAALAVYRKWCESVQLVFQKHPYKKLISLIWLTSDFNSVKQVVIPLNQSFDTWGFFWNLNYTLPHLAKWLNAYSFDLRNWAKECVNHGHTLGKSGNSDWSLNICLGKIYELTLDIDSVEKKILKKICEALINSLTKFQ